MWNQLALAQTDRDLGTRNWSFMSFYEICLQQTFNQFNL